MCMESVQFLATLAILMYYNVVVAIIALIIVIIGILLINRFSSKIGECTVALQNKSAIEQSTLIESIESIRTIKMLNKEDYISQEYENVLDDKKEISKKLSKYYALYADVFTFISNILPLITIVISIYFMLNGNMSVGDTIAIYSISGALTEPVSLLGEFFNNWQVTKALTKKNLMLTDNKEISLCNEVMDFEKIVFNSKGYVFDEKEVLKDISFEATKGKMYVLKGESGTGKSTIFNLLTKYLPSQNVDVKINNKLVNDINLKDLYKIVKAVDQNTIMFNKSIRENICLADDFSNDDIEEAIEVSQLKKLVDEKGLEFVIDDRAGNISGGEKQRIGICRMLLRKPKLLLLDEPTSALDENTADSFVKDINRYAKKYDITLMVITHRDDFTKIADEVICL